MRHVAAGRRRPARWLLPPGLAAAARERARWPQAIRAWQAQTVPSPPGIVVIEDRDRLLPLDLREDEDAEGRRRGHLRRARVICTELGVPGIDPLNVERSETIRYGG
jgi:lantibiotic biosynthesis protein